MSESRFSLRNGDAVRRRAPLQLIVVMVCLAFAIPIIAQDDFIRPPAEMRFVQVVTDEADVWVAGQPAAEGLPYATMTDYIPYYPENYPVRVTAGAVELSELVRTREGHRYTVLALPDALLILDETDLREDHPAGVDIIVHAAPDAPAIDLRWNSQLTAEGMIYGEYVVVDAAYGLSSPGGAVIYTDDTTRLWLILASDEAQLVIRQVSTNQGNTTLSMP